MLEIHPLAWRAPQPRIGHEDVSASIERYQSRLRIYKQGWHATRLKLAQAQATGVLAQESELTGAFDMSADVLREGQLARLERRVAHTPRNVQAQPRPFLERQGQTHDMPGIRARVRSGRHLSNGCERFGSGVARFIEHVANLCEDLIGGVETLPLRPGARRGPPLWLQLQTGAVPTTRAFFGSGHDLAIARVRCAIGLEPPPPPS